MAKAKNFGSLLVNRPVQLFLSEASNPISPLITPRKKAPTEPSTIVPSAASSAMQWGTWLFFILLKLK